MWEVDFCAVIFLLETNAKLVAPSCGVDPTHCLTICWFFAVFYPGCLDYSDFGIFAFYDQALLLQGGF